MKPHLLILVMVSALLGQTPIHAFQTNVERDLIVREVLLPQTGTWESRWSLPLFLAEPGNDRSTALFTNEALRGPGHLTGNPLAPSQLLTASGRQTKGGLDGFSIRAWGSSPGVPRCALLGTPNGMEFVAMDYDQAPDLKVWDLATGTFLRWIPHPPPLSGFEFIQNAGDVNGDSWDDIFFQDWAITGEVISGCLDGQSGQVIWMDYTIDHGGESRVKPLQPGPPPDLNGDGIGDFIAGNETIQVATLRHRLTAYSGVDGSILWIRDLKRSFIHRFSILCPDLDGDLVDDLISIDGATFTSGKNGEILAISGASGATIWSRDCTFFQSLYPNAIWLSVSDPLLVTPSPDGTGLDLVLRGRFIDGGTWLEETVFPFLDAKTGNVITTQVVTGTLDPWHPHDVPIDLPLLIQAGDYDGDGFQEFATTIYLEGEDTNSTTIYPYSLVILGQRTLFGPDKPKVGETVDFEIALPAHADAPFQMIFSTGFSPRTDKRIWNPQDWPTMLRTTGLIQKTLNTPALQGTLDANGQGAVTVTLPFNPAYIGVTFYARALITHPIYPGKIVTQSSLHTMTLQP